MGGGKEPLQQGESKNSQRRDFQFLLEFIKWGFIMVIGIIAFMVCTFCHYT